MELVARDRCNVLLRSDRDGGRWVVLSFPYDAQLVALARSIPHRRFDWDSREWLAPATDRAGIQVQDILERHPELQASDEVLGWLSQVKRRWIGSVSTVFEDGVGWWVLRTAAGPLPEGLDVVSDAGGAARVALTPAAAAVLREQRSALLDPGAERCLQLVLAGAPTPRARLEWVRGVEGEQLRLEVVTDPDVGIEFEQLQASEGTRRVTPDPWIVPELDAFIEQFGVQVKGLAKEVLERLRSEHHAAADAVGRSRAVSGDPLESVADVLGGTLSPYQWAGVHYALDARRTFIADEQGLGKTVEALATLEADGAFPAVVVCPASMKLVWEREIQKWVPHRSVAVINGRVPVPPHGDIVILNYEIVAAHREALARRRPAAIVVDESHYVKNPGAKRTQAVRALAASVRSGGLKLALTGTPVLNHADELIAQLRVIDRLSEFGSGARFSNRFRGMQSEERLHWHLRRVCFVRRLKSEVLPQLPAKRQVVVPVALTNTDEYRLAERDVIEWLRTQPLDLSDLNARIATTLRAERLAQLGLLQRLAASGKLAAAIAWIADFLASGEPLVVFARHVEVQEAVLRRFKDVAVHLLGADSAAARQAAIDAFQRPGGPQLIVCATRVAAQGITLTRASNVCFLELEWTPAIHDQAEDRCHRIGQRDAVTAWYLLAADTIDETMSRLIQRKRATVAAVTDGRVLDSDGLVEGVIRELRDGRPFAYLRAVS